MCFYFSLLFFVWVVNGWKLVVSDVEAEISEMPGVLHIRFCIEISNNVDVWDWKDKLGQIINNGFEYNVA